MTSRGPSSSDLANSDSMLALTHLTPRLSACPLLPSGGPPGPAALGFGQAPQKAPYSNDPASKHESCFCFSWTPHFHGPQINGYSLPNTITKNNARTSSL